MPRELPWKLEQKTRLNRPVNHFSEGEAVVFLGPCHHTALTFSSGSRSPLGQA